MSELNLIPKVSVILPINSDHGFLCDAINSILNQSFKDFEFIIVANNCSDKLWLELNEFANLDSRIKIKRLKIGGLIFALNYGLEIAKGEYIARMDADDISKRDRLIYQVNYLNEHKSTVVLGTQIELIDENNQLLQRQGKKRPVNDFEINEQLFKNSPLAHPTVIFRKEEIIKIGGYKYGFYGEDYELWLRCRENKYKMENLDEILLQYRIHNNQETDLRSFKKISDPVSALIFLYLKKTNNLKFLSGLLFQSKLYFFMVNCVKKVLGSK
ncbi:glycosyltransferase [Acinetobacter guillouiae]|jgi:glycosyltransferase involved in cell wall biosynthesis|uniref:glycosyltransferase n=1 Tax=Acinetobacter guillouiae TaxID=106649 RepID=UPI0028D37B08|nr:glycosyltransferase [Acinetobacter guillouiae]